MNDITTALQSFSSNSAIYGISTPIIITNEQIYQLAKDELRYDRRFNEDNLGYVSIAVQGASGQIIIRSKDRKEYSQHKKDRLLFLAIYYAHAMTLNQPAAAAEAKQAFMDAFE